MLNLFNWCRTETKGFIANICQTLVLCIISFLFTVLSFAQATHTILNVCSFTWVRQHTCSFKWNKNCRIIWQNRAKRVVKRAHNVWMIKKRNKIVFAQNQLGHVILELLATSNYSFSMVVIALKFKKTASHSQRTNWPLFLLSICWTKKKIARHQINSRTN